MYWLLIKIVILENKKNITKIYNRDDQLCISITGVSQTIKNRI